MLSQKETRLESGSLYSGLMPPLAPSPLLRRQDGTWLPAPLGLSRDPKTTQAEVHCNPRRPPGRPQSLGRAAAAHLQHSAHMPETHPEGTNQQDPAVGNQARLLGTPDTSRSGRNTRKARRALTSKPPDLPPEWLPPSVSLVNCSKITLNNLKEEERKKR